jgi:hypothetical protein
MLDWQGRKRHMSAIHNALLASGLVLALVLTVAWGGLLAYGLIVVIRRRDGLGPFDFRRAVDGERDCAVGHKCSEKEERRPLRIGGDDPKAISVPGGANCMNICGIPVLVNHAARHHPEGCSTSITGDRRKQFPLGVAQKQQAGRGKETKDGRRARGGDTPFMSHARRGCHAQA